MRKLLIILAAAVTAIIASGCEATDVGDTGRQDIGGPSHQPWNRPVRGIDDGGLGFLPQSR